MKVYWQIVPVNDGYYFLSCINGEYVLQHKALTYNKTLLFETKQLCVDYILTNLDVNKYMAEEVWLDEKFFGLC